MLPSILTYGDACLPNSMYSDALAHATVPSQAFNYSIIYLLWRWRLGEALWRNRLEVFLYSIACLSRLPSREAPAQNCLGDFRYNITCLSRCYIIAAVWRACVLCVVIVCVRAGVCLRACVSVCALLLNLCYICMADTMCTRVCV